MKSSNKNNIFLGLLGIILGILWLSPFYMMVANSFKTKKEIFQSPLKLPEGFHLDNYRQAAENLNFGHTFLNSLIITVVSVLIIIIFSSMAAYALSRVKSKVSTVIFFVFVAAMLIPFQAVMIPLVSLFGKLGMLNRPGIIFLYLGFGSSLSIFLYHGTINTLPKSLDEAAIIDGCNRFQVFWYIIFPILKPITVTVAILNTIWIWNDYLLPSLVINQTGKETIPLKMFFFFGEYTKQWHLALAGLTLAIIPVIIFYFIAQKHIIKGITAGSVK
ncbi:carbohydrate ABC transporter permease [Peptostreptococcus canis]|uniref:Carbohydrate ABC transporter permease n=1 Tax=Peptostreptococcus canis TaxID=1159213 RepID=A0ABR6TN81_9FIRM|nr:carbohydrate ABC transporter permease [Peptostreptococcus canis]MBC2576859.1 carbohydrate ABC transporter permease [Peptostreptococcus canis]MBP1998627.1 raffinose/stachyose/melibiose transport system permease protein [Peptostreptococcus canis]